VDRAGIFLEAANKLMSIFSESAMNDLGNEVCGSSQLIFMTECYGYYASYHIEEWYSDKVNL
jgi:hypothetical protein